MIGPNPLIPANPGLVAIGLPAFPFGRFRASLSAENLQAKQYFTRHS
jgi:hypothetical protein